LNLEINTSADIQFKREWNFNKKEYLFRRSEKDGEETMKLSHA